MKYWFSLLLCLCISGCATTTVVTANSTPARQATTPIAFDELMDVGILPINPNIPADALAVIQPQVLAANPAATAFQISYRGLDLGLCLFHGYLLS